MRQLTPDPALPVDTDGMPWIATGPGKAFRPLRFAADGWSELMRLEPGTSTAAARLPSPPMPIPSAPSTWPGAGSTTCIHPNGSSADPAGQQRQHRNGDKP